MTLLQVSLLRISFIGNKKTMKDMSPQKVAKVVHKLSENLGLCSGNQKQ